MSTVIALLHEGAKNHGDLAYLGGKTGDTWQTFSFKEVDALSSAFAAALLKAGLKKGDHAAILSEGRPSWVIGEFGILKAGCTSVPLSTRLTEEELIFRLNHSESKALLVSENNLKKAAEALKTIQNKPLLILISDKNPSTEGTAEKLLYYEEMLIQGKALLAGEEYQRRLQEIEEAIDRDDNVTISYTSGTTGNPKGIMLTHRNYIHNADNARKLVPVERGWKSLIMLPLDHSFAHTVGLYIFCIVGMTMYFVDAQGGPMAAIRNLPRNLQEVNPDVLLTVPALSGNFMKRMQGGINEKGALIRGIFNAGLRAGIRRAGDGYNRPPFLQCLWSFFPWALANALIFPKLRSVFGKNLRFCIGGGALLELKQQEFFNAIGIPVYQGYGLTENAPIICTNSAARHKFGTSGVVLPDLELRIMKDRSTECTMGEIGEIVTRGDSVMKGYFKNPEATEETLQEGWLWSGDLGYMDKDGFLVVTGREKALLIAPDGEKYSPETIEEAVLSTSKYINQIMAYNEQCRFTSALITLNTEELLGSIKNQGLSPQKDEDLNKVLGLIWEDLTSFTRQSGHSSIPGQWRPASFAVLGSAFDEARGEINSTMKLVRHRVRDLHMDRIEEIYRAGAGEFYTEGNRKVIKDILSLEVT